jgi:hypothetical protein
VCTDEALSCQGFFGVFDKSCAFAGPCDQLPLEIVDRDTALYYRRNYKNTQRPPTFLARGLKNAMYADTGHNIAVIC